MKLIVCTDSHIDIDENRLKENFNINLDIAKYAKKVNADYFLHLGDLFDSSNPSRHAYKYALKLCRFLNDCNFKSIFLNGNHDVENKKNDFGALTLLEEVGFKNIEFIYNITNFNAGKVELYDDQANKKNKKVNFILIPHISKAHINIEKYKSTDEFAETICTQIVDSVNEEDIVIAFAHTDIIGNVKLGSEQQNFKGGKFHLPNVIKNSHKVNAIYLAHYHSHQIIKDFKNNIYVVGSTNQHSFSEKDDIKGFLEIDI